MGFLFLLVEWELGEEETDEPVDAAMALEEGEEPAPAPPPPVSSISVPGATPFILSEIGHRWLLPAVWRYLDSYVLFARVLDETMADDDFVWGGLGMRIRMAWLRMCSAMSRAVWRHSCVTRPFSKYDMPSFLDIEPMTNSCSSTAMPPHSTSSIVSRDAASRRRHPPHAPGYLGVDGHHRRTRQHAHGPYDGARSAWSTYASD